MAGPKLFSFQELSLKGAYEITRHKLEDDRGYLERIFCGQDLAARTGFGPVAQINRTFTRAAGVVRGMHYQSGPSLESKIIMCLQGAIHDVIVDLRAGSPSFLRSTAVTLACETNTLLFVPRGFAHGFQTIAPNTELLYLHDAYYDPDNEHGLCPLDPKLAIDWPLKISQMSKRDRGHAKITNNFEGLSI